jgi:hypothetical protein
MADSKAKLPAPESDDPDDVVLALETAKALWGRGDPKEAIRWLRRAAEAAETAGNDMRSLTLARTAAELASQVQDEAQEAQAASAPPAARAPAPVATPPKPAAKAPAAAAAPRPEPAAPPREPTPAAAPEPARPASPPAPVTMSQPPPPMAASRRAEPPVRSSPATSGGDRTKDAMAHLAALASADATTGTTRTRRSLGPYQALRVSVEPSKDDRKLLVVKVLNQNEQAPASAHEALLVALQPNVDMRSRKRTT